MSDRLDLINKHLSDQTALERHILDAVGRQRNDDDVRNNVEANRVIIEIERVLKSHVEALDNLTNSYGAEGESVFKKAVTAAAGVVAGLYDKIRESPVTRMLRDNYTALSLASMGYTTMHAFAMAIKEPRLEELSLNHLKDITPLLVEISKVIPVVTVQEQAKEHPGLSVDTTVAQEAVRHTQSAWERSVTESLT